MSPNKGMKLTKLGELRSFAAYPRCSTDQYAGASGMTRSTSDRPDDHDVPSELVRELNELGFALVSSTRTHTFARTAIGNELELTLEPLGSSVWRVGLKWRPSTELGRAPYALVPVSLGRLGESEDGVTIDLSTTLLVDTLPRLLTESILPLADLAPG